MVKIEIKGNSTSYNLHYGDQVLFINDEEVLKGSKKEIIEKLNSIISVWI